VGERVRGGGEVADALVQFGTPGLGEPGPVRTGRSPLLGKFGERLTDGGQRDADALGGAYERDPAQCVALVAALVARCTAAADQTLGLVEVQGGDGGAATRGQLAYAELVDGLGDLGHPAEPTHRVT